MTIRQDKRLNQFLNDKNFQHETEIQKQAFSTIVKGKDLIAISKTGTGKTLAYLMPLFKLINPEEGRIQALILSPTQELSQQIFSVAKELQKYFPEILDEDIIKDRKYYYPIVKVRHNDLTKKLSEDELNFGPILINKPNKVFHDYLMFCKRIEENILQAQKKESSMRIQVIDKLLNLNKNLD